MRERGEDGPIHKAALREAYRRAERDGVLDTGAGRLKKRRLASGEVNLTLLRSQPNSLKTSVTKAMPPECDGPLYDLARESLNEQEADDDIDAMALQQELNL